MNNEIKKATDKANLGLSKNSAVIVQQGVGSSTLWIAEGIETALSVAKAVPNDMVVASLSASKLQNVPVANNIQTVVICADNDPASANTKSEVIKAVEYYLSIGKKVFIAMPSEIQTGMKKGDFNAIASDIQTVVICADNDPVSSNTKAEVLKAVEHYLSIGKGVFIAIPPEIQTGMKNGDFNDLLKHGGVDAVRGVVNNRVEIRDAGLLKSEGSLSSSVEKIRGSERGGSCSHSIGCSFTGESARGSWQRQGVTSVI